MPAAPIPADEARRLSVLRELLLLDTPPEERFDKLVGFAAAQFDVPISLFSLVDSERQWFKASVGLGTCETSREMSFCAHAILRPELLVVTDTFLDERFADNPLVTGPPHIRFYAGAPLTLPSGVSIGTLCLVDTKPRELDNIDRVMLASLRDLLIEELLSQQAQEAR